MQSIEDADAFRSYLQFLLQDTRSGRLVIKTDDGQAIAVFEPVTLSDDFIEFCNTDGGNQVVVLIAKIVSVEVKQ